MKTLAILLALGLTGCSTIQRALHADGLTRSERAEAKEKAEAEAQANAEKLEAAWNSLHPGMTKTDIQNIWGKPDKIEFMGGGYIWTYDNDENPIIFGFKDQYLAGWEYDRVEKQHLEDSYERRRIANEQARAARSSASAASWAAAFGAFSTIRSNQPAYCTTNKVGTTSYTNCR